MAVQGEPLSYRHGVCLWSAQTTYGTPVTPATSAGTVDATLTRGSGNQSFFGPGSATLFAQKGGLTTSDIELAFRAIQNGGSKSLLLKAVRAAAGSLPLITFGIGEQDDTPTTPLKRAKQVQDCKVDTLSLNFDASSGHGPLTASMGIIGGLCSDLTSLVPSAITASPYYTYECALTEEGSGYEVRSLAFNLANNLRRDTVIPGATPSSFIRGHKYLTEGNIVITGSISRFVPSGQNVHANTLSERDLVITATNLDDATTLVLTITDAVYDNERTAVSEEGILYTYDYTARSFNLA